MHQSSSIGLCRTALKFAVPFLCGALFTTMLHQWSGIESRSAYSLAIVQPNPPPQVGANITAAQGTTAGDNDELDRLAYAAGTDKASPVHAYSMIYPAYFARFRDKPIRLVEIGIYKGYSVKMWEPYFPLAELHFVELERKNVEYFGGDRSHYHFFDQANVSALEEFAKRHGPFDIIVDDGGHMGPAQNVTFRHLFPHVKPGGLYIVEDLQTSYWRDYGGLGDEKGDPVLGPNTTIAFLRELIDEMNSVGARTGQAGFGRTNEIPADKLNLLSYIALHIESLTFYNSLCIITAK